MSTMSQEQSRSRETETPSRWYQRFPDPMVLIFYILLIASALTWLVPKGAYDTETVDGRQRVIAGSFHYLTESDAPAGVFTVINKLFDIFVAIPQAVWYSRRNTCLSCSLPAACLTSCTEPMHWKTSSVLLLSVSVSSAVTC